MVSAKSKGCNKKPVIQRELELFFNTASPAVFFATLHLHILVVFSCRPLGGNAEVEFLAFLPLAAPFASVSCNVLANSRNIKNTHFAAVVEV